MNNSQRIYMMADLWPHACEFQGWNRNDQVRRYEVFARVLTAEDSPRRDYYLGLIDRDGKIGTNLISNEDDISAVFKELKQLAGKVPTYDAKKKQLLWVVRNHLRPCLALYVEAPDLYMEKILKERHKVFRGLTTIEDLSAQPAAGRDHSELQMFIYTLSRCIDDMRKENHDTIHGMCVAARVKCKCAQCAKHGQRHLQKQPRHEVQPEMVHAGQVVESEGDGEVDDDNVPF